MFAPELSTKLGGVPLGTIRYLDSTGYGPRSFKIGKRRAWRTSEILRWLAEQEATTASGAAS